MSEQSNLTLPALLQKNAEENPAGTAIEYCGKVWTWSEALRAADAVSKAMLARGIKKGSHVGIISSDSPSFLLFMLAVHKIGGVSVLFNPAYSKSEIEELIEFTDIELLATGCAYRENDLKALTASLTKPDKLKEIICMGEDPSSPEFMAFCEAGKSADDKALDEAFKAVKPEDTANILFTSGTTGRPKAVMISHFAQVNTSIDQAGDLKATSLDKFCVGIPMFHCFCLSATIFAALSVSAALCFPESLRTAKIMKTVSDCNCTVLNSVPSLFFALIARQDFSSYDVSALRIGLIGGAGYTTEQFKSIEDSFGFTLMASLGMTEATGGVTVTNPEDSLHIRSTTVGHFMKNVRGSICDIDSGEELPDGETGEICISGFMVMQGYYKQPELTKLAIDEKGRLHSGDLGFIDKKGNLHVTGRIKELINRGGEKISPNQIESVIGGNDSRIKAVKAIGIPDAHYGEEICACIILNDGAQISAEEIREIVREKLAKYKVPKYVLFFESFPYNFKGKVTNKVLQEEAIKMLKEQELY